MEAMSAFSAPDAFNAAGESDLYFTPAELCARYKCAISERTLANWRSKSEGPEYTKIGGKVLYPKQAVLEWERRRTAAFR